MGLATRDKQRMRWNYNTSRWQSWNGYSGKWSSEFIRKCPQCSEMFIGAANRLVCRSCYFKAYDERKRITAKVYAEMNSARRNGLIPVIDGTTVCVDCGAPAECHDHRDYSKPLHVEPVCRSCNVRRGPAAGVEHLFRKNRINKSAGERK